MVLDMVSYESMYGETMDISFYTSDSKVGQ